MMPSDDDREAAEAARRLAWFEQLTEARRRGGRSAEIAYQRGSSE